MIRNVIIITDGDSVARRAIETAAKNIKARTISASAGNPTPLKGKEIVELIKQAKHDPVIVMFDDRGSPLKGDGEIALEVVARHPDIKVMGAIAVASNTDVEGVECDLAVTKEGEIINGTVDKSGEPYWDSHKICGDTVDILRELDIPIIIGIGDVGKMNGRDDFHRGAKITTKALNYIISQGGLVNGPTR
ncbi:MAG: stage V sporulation protein AE [Clostridiaceae bacterium BRH_c20a]|nr:MAG: stage V sporulation protein AE [Clostridiaceae bacterium BRH_c20a]